MDRPYIWHARAIQTAHEKRRYGGVFLGFGELDTVMNGLARILWFQRRRLTKTQLRIAELLRQGPVPVRGCRRIKDNEAGHLEAGAGDGMVALRRSRRGLARPPRQIYKPMIEKSNVSHQR